MKCVFRDPPRRDAAIRVATSATRADYASQVLGLRACGLPQTRARARVSQRLRSALLGRRALRAAEEDLRAVTNRTRFEAFDRGASCTSRTRPVSFLFANAPRLGSRPDERRLIVEVDGASHRGRVSADARRDRFLAKLGYRILRLDAGLVLQRPALAIARIQAALARS